jgi:predicted transcriptional regulator
MGQNEIALENQIRKMIYKHITEYPGVSFSTLKKFYELNDSTLRYHLKYLERAEKITSQIKDGILHFYLFNRNLTGPNTVNTNSMAPQLSPEQNNILNVIKQYPGINQSELISQTSLKRHVIGYNISQLLDLGMVRKVNNGRNVCYEHISNDLLEYEMLKILAVKFLRNEIDEQTYLRLRSQLKKE